MQKQTVIPALLKNDLFFFSIVTIIILVSFVLFVPKVSNMLIPQKRTEILQTFINDTQKKKDIDLQHYWKFREFYSPGTFIYEKIGLSNSKNTKIMSLISQDPLVTPQLLFSSPRVKSIGGKTKTKMLPPTIDTYKNILLQTKSVVLSENDTEIFLMFLKPVSEVKKANGFLENQPAYDEKQGDMWLEITTIQK